jgi:HTH-type transcriptional regulator, sugar sensing transcriptional regulator
MSREWVLKTLVDLGLSKVEAEVYIFIVQAGPVKGSDIADTLKLYKQQVYRSLKTLRDKGMINATSNRPNQFSAVSLERILDLFMKTKTEQAKNLQSNREKLLSSWRSMIEKHSANS